MKARHGMLAALAAVGLMLAGCLGSGGGAVERLAERLAPQLLTYLGPTASALLGPEVGQIVNLLQSRGAVAVERAFDVKLALLEDRILRGEIATRDAAQEAQDKAAARMKLLRRLRKGNDYSQRVQALNVIDRAALELGRATVDARYEAVRVALADLGAVEANVGASEPLAAAVEPTRLPSARPSLAAAAASSEMPSWDEVIGLCHAAMYKGETARVAARFAAMAENVRHGAMVVCSAYGEGVAAERENVPAGAAVAI